MILDTNAVSALADGDSAISSFIAHADELVLPVIVLGEYRYGINQSRHRLRYQVWLAELISVSRILDLDRFTTDSYAVIARNSRPRANPSPPTISGSPPSPANTASPSSVAIITLMPSPDSSASLGPKPAIT